MKIYAIKDADGKVWKDTVNTNKDMCILGFTRSFLTLLPNIDVMDAHRFWGLFKKNGWEIEEFEVKQHDA